MENNGLIAWMNFFFQKKEATLQKNELFKDTQISLNLYLKNKIIKLKI